MNPSLCVESHMKLLLHWKFWLLLPEHHALHAFGSTSSQWYVAELHMPLTQAIMFIGHCLPHMPQFIGSFWRSAHFMLQTVSPILQQSLWRHCSPIMHGLVHMPQLSMSVCKSTQAPPHSAFPIGHTIAHDPLMHFHVPPPMMAPASAPQVCPHLPQLLSSVLVST